jgi:hypothetical protein
MPSALVPRSAATSSSVGSNGRCSGPDYFLPLDQTKIESKVQFITSLQRSGKSFDV